VAQDGIHCGGCGGVVKPPAEEPVFLNMHAEVPAEEPKDNSLPPCSDCAREESSCENERQTCTSPEDIHVLTQAGPEEEK